jgi:methionyl-tRNA formyltransferase
MSSPPARYLVAGSKSWNRRVFDEQLKNMGGEWRYVEEQEQLSTVIRQFHPRYVFFLHWSWKVPVEIVEDFECVCFHMTDVPYGRGGSPLQNLISRGLRDTKLTALRMAADFDAGPVYLKKELSLVGGAEEIYIRACRLSASMIREIIEQGMRPLPQTGEVVNFARRKPEESQIGDFESLDQLHDFIRMLDADGYPRAFLVYAGYRFEFSRSALYDGRVLADVTITRDSQGVDE